MKYFVCYDISGNKGRRYVDKILKGYGIRYQYSVFFCELEINEHKRLINDLKLMKESNKKLFIEKHDSIVIIPVCDQCYKKTVLFLKEINENKNVII